MASSWIPVSSPLAGVAAHRQEIDEAIRRVLDSGNYILGAEVEAFESEFAAYAGLPHAVGVNSGTDALSLTIRGLGIGLGDEIITVSHTAVATVAAIEQAGATPVLVDIEPRYMTIDPAAVEAAISPKTRAVIAVHLYGGACDLDALVELCDHHGLALIEDCSQAHGTTFRGRHVGSLGVAGVFSCYPTKNLGALGDAGIIVTGDRALADRLKRLRQYGWEERNSSLEPGFNSRLDEIQAAILRVQLTHLAADIGRRRDIAGRYLDELGGSHFSLPSAREFSESSYHLFVLRHSDREGIRSSLESSMIQTAIHYPAPVHKQPAYAGRIKTGISMRNTDKAAQEVLSIPMFPALTDEDVERVITALSDSATHASPRH